MKPLFVSVETGCELARTPDAQVWSSARAPWRGFFLEQIRPIRVEHVNVVALKHLMVFQLEGSITYEWKSEGRSKVVRQAPGSFSLFPAFTPYTVKTNNTGEFLSIALEPNWFRCTTEAMIKPRQLDLHPCHGAQDPVVSSLAHALKAEVEGEYPGGSRYGESLASMLAIQLARCCAKAAPVPTSNRGGLARPQLRRVFEFIQDHLAENISLKHLAGSAGLSPFHFSRLFKHSTGIPPHQYLVQRRIERAKELLLTSGRSLSQIALEAGFCEQSHLTRQFKLHYGVTPRRFRLRFANGEHR